MEDQGLRAAFLAAGFMFAAGAALAGETPAPAGAEVYFIDPQDGAIVSSPVTVKFGLRGMGVAPAGVEKDNTGHHHLLIDIDAPGGEALDAPLPADDHHKHFGGGQTETTVELTPETHSLQLLLGDWSHIPTTRRFCRRRSPSQ